MFQACPGLLQVPAHGGPADAERPGDLFLGELGEVIEPDALQLAAGELPLHGPAQRGLCGPQVGLIGGFFPVYPFMVEQNPGLGNSSLQIFRMRKFSESSKLGV